MIIRATTPRCSRSSRRPPRRFRPRAPSSERVRAASSASSWAAGCTRRRPPTPPRCSTCGRATRRPAWRSCNRSSSCTRTSTAGAAWPTIARWRTSSACSTASPADEALAHAVARALRAESGASGREKDRGGVVAPLRRVGPERRRAIAIAVEPMRQVMTELRRGRGRDRGALARPRPGPLLRRPGRRRSAPRAVPGPRGGGGGGGGRPLSAGGSRRCGDGPD